MNRLFRKYPNVLVFAVAAFGALHATSCAEDVIPPKPLSQSLNQLAAQLDAAVSCSDKYDALEVYLSENREMLFLQRAQFEKTCRSGHSDDMQCMSLQLLASARVQVALKDCACHEPLRAPLRELNEIAHIAVALQDSALTDCYESD